MFADTEETKCLRKIESIIMFTVATYSCFICVMANQMIADVLKSISAFSIALDGGNKSSSYLDGRIRLCVEELIHNLHLVAFSMRDRSILELEYPCLI
jgi:hypothetical protein